MKRSILMISLVFLITSVSMAQSFSIGPEVGYYKTKDADKGTLLYGASARLTFAMFGVEGTVHYGEEKFYNDMIKVQRYPVSVSGMFFPLPFVYACGGLDWLNAKTTTNIPGFSDQSETSSEVGFHFGAGVHLSLGSIVLKGDARYIMMGKMKIPSQGEIDNSVLELSVGLLFHL
jgi:hypothetical protein